MKSITIFQEDGKFAGWPANHGVWDVDGKDMVVFDLCQHRRQRGYHCISEDRPASVVSFFNGQTTGLPGFEGQPPFIEMDSPPLIEKRLGIVPENAIIKIRHDWMWFFDDSWHGPYKITVRALSHLRPTSRTCVFRTQSKWLLLLSFCKPGIFGSDNIYLCETSDFKDIKVVCRFPDDGKRSVMPSAIIGDGGGLVVAVRRKDKTVRPYLNYIQIATQEKEGSFSFKEKRFSTGGKNGNPPALTFNNGIYYLVYGHRAEPFGIYLSLSRDIDKWSDPITLWQPQKDEEKDLGYPRCILRGNTIVTYFYAGGKIIRVDHEIHQAP